MKGVGFSSDPTKSSFLAFKDVDEQTAKPVLGSDGAARWQDFKKGAGKNTAAGNTLSSVAPNLPLKRIDRVGLGTRSINEERANEAAIRRDAGEEELGSGYKSFKRKQDPDEVAAQKRRKMILDRIRPDGVPYFLKAESFEGFKEDYVFTTRDRGTGYYWDGMCSRKRELGQDSSCYNGSNVDEVAAAGDGDKKKPTVAKKKKKKKDISLQEPPDSDPFNPMEQVAQAIVRRKQALEAPPSALLGVSNSLSDAAALGATSIKAMQAQSRNAESLEPELKAAGWEAAKDPNSGKTYYFRRSTNETSWKKPELPTIAASNIDNNIPDGWKSAKDPKSGKLYYYHISGMTSWEKPKS